MSVRLRIGFIALLFLFAAVTSMDLLSKERINREKKVADVNGVKSKKLKLTVQKVVEYLLKNNHDVKRALLEYKGASSGLLLFKSKYDINLFGSAAYSHTANPNPSLKMFQGESTDMGNYTLGLQKNFSTGTSIQAGVNGLIQNIHGAGTQFYDISSYYMSRIGGMGYQAGIQVQITQELLRNAFGITDRLTKSKIANATKMSKQIVKMKLAGLLVEALIGYWNVAIAEKNLKTSEVSLKSTMEIRNIITRKMRLGLSEREEILDWNGKVLQSRNNNERAKKLLFDAKLAVIRILNLDLSTDDIEIGTSFKTTPPLVQYKQALKDAFIKRVDWNNQRSILKNSELEYRIADNNLLPSLKLKLGAGSKDYSSDSYAKTFDNINEEYSVGLEMTYPLGNRAARVKMRDARLALKKESVNIEALRKKIKDEITSIVKQCQVDYNIYILTKKSKGYAQNYYYQVLMKFRRGRYSALQIKFARDGYIMAMQAELQSLVNYNISLIRRDFARNVIFEDLGIDIDRILKRLEN